MAEGNKNIYHNNFGQNRLWNNGQSHGQLPAVDSPQLTNVPIPVAQEAGGDTYRGFTDIPDHLKFRQDREKHRSTSELRSVFVFCRTDNISKDVPRVLQLLCAYLVGLQIVRKRLQDASHDSMETDAPETEPPELFDDDASDADYIWCGMTSEEFCERLKSAKESAKNYSWFNIYEQFIHECCTEEIHFAAEVRQLRNNPGVDVKYFCRNNLIAHTNSMIEKWKQLSAVAATVQSEVDALKKYKFPCMAQYSDTELHFGPDEYLQRWITTSHSTLPEKWKLIDGNNSNMIRQIHFQVNGTCKKLRDVIMTKMEEMNDTRKESFIKLCSCNSGLKAIVSTLRTILSNSIRDGQEPELTEEEVWYNEFDFSYADMHNKNDDDRANAMATWHKTEKLNRHNLSTGVCKWCDTLHQRYGELVKTLRTRRESLRPGITTHVSELEKRAVQQQSKISQMEEDFKIKEEHWLEKDFKTMNRIADLTTQLDDVKYKAHHIEQQLNSQWNQHCQQMNEEHNQQIKTQQAKQDGMMNRITDLKREKENLLTRLSKIAGSKLVQGNPAITDLSDTNRPTKLSERYSELYDNEWTDALEELIDRHVIVQGGDVVCTQILLAILVESFKFCCETEAAYVKTIKQSVTSLPGSDPDGADHDRKETSNETSLSQEQNQQLNDVIKAGVLMMTPAVKSKFLALMEKQFEHMVKQLGGSIKSAGLHEPGMSEDTDSQATKLDTAELDESNQPKSEESDSTQNSTPTSDKDAMSLTDSSPSEQGPNDDKRHRHFNQGPSNVVLDQGNKDTEDTCHGSAITNTTCLVRFSSLEKTNDFAKCCVNLCWLMRSQNPPLHMDTELAKDSDINIDFYKNYTQKGKKVDFLVWPALFLHKDGPLLCKGIVQPLSNRKG